MSFLGNYTYEIKRLKITISEIKNLPKSYSKMGSFVEVIVQGNDNYVCVESTHMVRGSTSPMWLETFDFELPDEKQTVTIHYKVLTNNTMKTKCVSSIVFKVEDFGSYERREEWCLLSIPEKKVKDNNNATKMRIEVTYIEDILLPPDAYGNFQTSILENRGALKYMAQQLSSRDWESFSLILIRILKEVDPEYLVLFIEDLLIDVINESYDQNILFREASLASKIVECFLLVFGLDWSRSVLRPTLKRLVGDDFVDLASDNTDAIRELFDHFLGMIYAIKYAEFPLEIQHILHVIATQTKAKFDDPDVTHISISSFLILRLFSPILLNPKLFGLINFQLTPAEAENFKNFSQFLQKLGNLAIFRSEVANLELLNEILIAEQDNMKKFILEVSEPVSGITFEKNGELMDKVYPDYSKLTRLLYKNRSLYEEGTESLADLDKIALEIHKEFPNYWKYQLDIEFEELSKIEDLLKRIEPSFNFGHTKRDREVNHSVFIVESINYDSPQETKKKKRTDSGSSNGKRSLKRGLSRKKISQEVRKKDTTSGDLDSESDSSIKRSQSVEPKLRKKPSQNREILDSPIKKSRKKKKSHSTVEKPPGDSTAHVLFRHSRN